MSSVGARRVVRTMFVDKRVSAIATQRCKHFRRFNSVRVLKPTTPTSQGLTQSRRRRRRLLP